MYKSFRQGAFEFGSNLRQFPQDLRTIVHLLRTGAKVNVEIEHQELNQLTREIDRSSHHMTTGMIISALVVTTGLLVLANLGPVFWGVPVMAWVTIVMALLLTLALVMSMIIEKKEVVYGKK